MNLQSCMFVDQATRDIADAFVGVNGSKLWGKIVDSPYANNCGAGEILGKYMYTTHFLHDPDYADICYLFANEPIHIIDCDVAFLPDDLPL